MEERKTLKQLSKEAKMRLKSGFWKERMATIKAEIEKGKEKGIPASTVKEYYQSKIYEQSDNPIDENEIFYLQVKAILDAEGEVSNAIGRLTDKAYYDTLTYEEKQIYTLKLAEKYRQAVERYKKEKLITSI